MEMSEQELEKLRGLDPYDLTKHIASIIEEAPVEARDYDESSIMLDNGSGTFVTLFYGA